MRIENGEFTGTQDSMLTINNIDTSDAGIYTCVVSNICGYVTTYPATLTVNQPITITQQPIGGTYCGDGSIFTFSVGVTGTQPIYYQWNNDGENWLDSYDSLYTIGGIYSWYSGNWNCVATNVCGTVYSL